MKRPKIPQSYSLWSGFIAVLASNWFYIGLLVFFFIEMAWIALSAIYPMLFDEEYHLGIIEIYSRQLSPFIATQPPEAAFHGDITRYGSYLFHYLMSVPYWLVSHITNDLTTQVIALRFICIGIVIAGVAMWRKVLLMLKISRSITHLALAIFVLIPIVPFALSQLNYDSLAFLLVPVLFFFTLKTSQRSQKQLIWAILLVGLASLSCLVKFTMLPVALACILFVAFAWWRQYGKRIWSTIGQQYENTSWIVLGLSIAFLVLSLGLFAERYGVNIIKYHAIEPKCDRLHSGEECLQYTVWRRDVAWRENNKLLNTPRNDPLTYSVTYWAPHIFSDFFVTGAFVYDKDQPLQIRYLPTTMQASAGTLLLRVGGWSMLVLSIICIAFAWKYLWNTYRNLIIILILAVGIYSLSLWLRNYGDYLNIGAGTAAQGRYFIPFLIPIIIVASLAFSRVLGRARYKALLMVVSIIFLSQGGGVANYILYSNARWYWPDHRQTISKVNSGVRNVLRLFTP